MKEELKLIRIAQEISYAYDYVLYPDEITHEIFDIDDLKNYSMDEIKKACENWQGYNDGDMDRQLIMAVDKYLES